MTIAKGQSVSSWTLPSSEGLVTREGGLGRDPGRDVLEVRVIDDKPTLFVLPLNAPLEPLDPLRVVAIDEKPLSPDAPCSERMSALGVRHSVGSSRSSTWTVTPVINAAGDLIFTQLITRGGSVGCGTLVQIANYLHLARTEKGFKLMTLF